MRDAHLDLLKRTAILQGLSPEHLERLIMANPTEVYRRHQAIFEVGSRDRGLYIVLEGEVAVKIDPAKLGTIEKGSTELRTIRTFGPGESFGEIDLIDGQGREATVVAARDNTRLMIISSKMFDDVLQAQIILNNITRDLASKVRGSNQLLIETMLSGYFLTVLVDELASGSYECDPITPLQNLVVIRNPENFILSGPEQLIPHLPEKEALEVSFFSEPHLLQTLAGSGEPSGAIIFSALFSIIKWGQISRRIEAAPFQYELKPDTDRRAGTLRVNKTIAGRVQPFTLEWQVKGARYNEEKATTIADLFLYIYTEEASSSHSRASQIIDGIDMPVQKYICQSLPQDDVDKTKFRVIVVHHRSHETARTLRTMQELGYRLDTFIGIPYGDVNWDRIIMLDHAANHNYLSLKMVQHPIEPTRYHFDFRQSSFLDTQTERDLLALYADPAVTADYLTAMQALGEYRLEQALRKCRERGERLIIYEDGAYIVARIYEIYKNLAHRLHSLVKAAVDDGLIVGVVEVTVAGERKNIQVIEENNGRALLPVLSNARSDIKAVFEAMGVAEAVTQAAATSLGRLGLPTFQTRRVAVLGGNGAIGTRLVEQFTKLHNSTTNVFAVDITDRPFSFELDRQALPYAATRLKYHPLPRYAVEDTCWPIILDAPYSERVFQSHCPAIAQAITAFLRDDSPYQELALANSYSLPKADLTGLWQVIAQETGYRRVGETLLPHGAGMRYRVEKGGVQKTVTLLTNFTVLTFRNVSRPIRSGVDTVVGSTGYPIFSAKNLDDFLARPKPPGGLDELVLISASSKDYEFRPAIDFLNILLRLHVRPAVPTEQKLGWFADFYNDGLNFLQDEDFVPLQHLLATPLSPESLQAFVRTAPAVARAARLTGDNSAHWPDLLADFIAEKIRRSVTIHKEIRPDIGSIYHLVVNDRVKRVVLLADGLVVNFFARHEKGVKTEFIDPVVTMQLLSLVKLSTGAIAPALYKMDTQLRPEDLAVFWAAIDDKCRPLTFNCGRS